MGTGTVARLVLGPLGWASSARAAALKERGQLVPKASRSTNCGHKPLTPHAHTQPGEAQVGPQTLSHTGRHFKEI